MAAIAKLNVNLTANATGLIKGLERGTKSVKRFGKGVDQVGGGIRGKFSSAIGGATAMVARFASRVGGMMVRQLKYGAIALGGAAVATVWFTRRQAEAIDTNAKLSRQLGLSYRELKTFQYHAGLAGVESEQFGTAFAKMSDTIGAAMMGEKSAVRAFERIGVSVSDLARMSPAQRFVAISEALNRIGDPAQKIAAVRDIFGRAGVDMITVFEGGAAAIAGAAQKAEAFGLVLSKFETDNIEYMNDRVADLGTILGGIGDQLAARIAPYVAELADMAIQWVEEMGGVEPVLESVLESFGTGIDWLLEKTIPLQAAWQTVADIVKSISDGVGFISRMIPDVVKTSAGRALNPVGTAAGMIGSGVSGMYRSRKAELDAVPEQDKFASRVTRSISRFSDRARRNAQGRAYDSRAAEQKRELAARPPSRRDQEKMAQLQRRAQQNPEWFRGIDGGNKMQRLQRQAQRHPEWFRGVDGGRKSNNMQNQEEVNLLRQIAMNTGKNQLSYAG